METFDVERKVWRETEDFLLEYHEWDGEFHGHVQIFNNSHSKYRRYYYDVMAEFMNFAKSLGYDEVWSVSPNPKFCMVMGGEMVCAAEEEGYYVMRWET